MKAVKWQERRGRGKKNYGEIREIADLKVFTHKLLFWFIMSVQGSIDKWLGHV